MSITEKAMENRPLVSGGVVATLVTLVGLLFVSGVI